MPALPVTGPLWTVKEYAAYTRVHVITVYKRIGRGEQVGVVRIGRTIRIDPVQVFPKLATPRYDLAPVAEVTKKGAR
jgi:hypothetical protein